MNLSRIAFIGLDGNVLGVIFVGSGCLDCSSACVARISGMAGGRGFIAELGIALRDEEGIQDGQARDSD